MATFFFQLFLIRLKQLWRALAGVGWLLVIALPMAVVFLLVIWDKLADLEPLTLGIVSAFPFLTVHWRRQDMTFLRKCGAFLPLILLLEYQLCLLFISVPVVWISREWSAVLWTHLTVGLISLLPGYSGNRRMQGMPLRWIPTTNLEWKSGIRKNWAVLLPVYLAGIFLSVYIPGALLSLLIILLIVLGFYDEIEARIILENALQPDFLRKKWARHYGHFVLSFLPHIALFLFFHYRYWYLLVFCLFVSAIFLACAIFYKYSVYLPYRQSANNQTAVSLLLFTLIIPFLSPLSLAALFILHRKAEKRLQYFFPYAGD